MAATHKTFLCLFLFFGIVGLGLHLAGFVMPGWIVMKRSVMDIRLLGMTETELTEHIRITQGQLIDRGGVHAPPEGEPHTEDMDGHHGKGGHGGSHDELEDKMREQREDEMMKKKQDMMNQKQQEMMKSKGGEMMTFEEEDITFHKFILTVMAEVSYEHLSFHYGLWYTKICAHKMRPDGHEMDDHDMDDDDEVKPEGEPRQRRHAHSSSSSSSSEDHDGNRKHHKKCHCVKVSTKCALKNAMLVESPASMKNRISPSNMGHGSLKEHRVETAIALGLMLIGLICGVATFRKADGCRCIKVATVLIMLVAVILVSVPVMRMAHYTHYRRNLHDGVYAKCPYSAILSGAGCIMVLLSALIALCGLIAQKRMATRSGQWYRFNNDMAEEKKSEKGPALVFYNDPYPVKAGLTDVCDFSDIKPVEADTEPEKKPIE